MHQLSVSARRIWSDSICGGFASRARYKSFCF